MREVIGLDFYNQTTTGGVAMPLRSVRGDNEHTPCVLIKGGCYTVDEKMGQTYIHKECANTLAQRDYKQPQAVFYETDRNDSGPTDSKT